MMHRRQIPWGWMIVFVFSYSSVGTILYLSSAPLGALVLLLSGTLAWAVVNAEPWELIGVEGIQSNGTSIIYGTIFGVMAWGGVKIVASGGALALAVSAITLGFLVWAGGFRLGCSWIWNYDRCDFG